jgi:hypothetical protein
MKGSIILGWSYQNQPLTVYQHQEVPMGAKKPPGKEKRKEKKKKKTADKKP